MNSQVSREEFAQALRELGHDPLKFAGQKISIDKASEIYEIEQDIIMEAIDRNYLHAHYDYDKDTIWLDALETAHFHYCIRTEAKLYA